MNEQLQLIQLMLDDLRFRNPSSFYYEHLIINDAKKDDVLKIKATLEEIERKLKILVEDKYPGDSAAIAVMAEQVESLFKLQCENASSRNNNAEQMTINEVIINGTNISELLRRADELSNKLSLNVNGNQGNNNIEKEPFYLYFDGILHGVGDTRLKTLTNLSRFQLLNIDKTLLKDYVLFLLPKELVLSVLHYSFYNANDDSVDFSYGALDIKTKKFVALNNNNFSLFGIRLATGNNAVATSLISDSGSGEMHYSYNPKGLINDIKCIEQFGYVAIFRGYNFPCTCFVQAWEDNNYSNVYAQILSKQVINGDTIVKVIVHGVKTNYPYQRKGRTTCNLTVVLIGDGEELTNSLRQATGNNDLQVGLYSNLGNEYLYTSFDASYVSVKNTLSPRFVLMSKNNDTAAFSMIQSHAMLNYPHIYRRMSDGFSYNLYNADHGQLQPEHLAKQYPVSFMTIQGLKQS